MPQLQRYSEVFLTADLGDRSAEVYAQRRQKFLAELSGPCLLAGVTEVPGSSEAWFNQLDRRVQNPQLLYFTGVNQPQVYVWFNPLAVAPEMQTVLFLPTADPVHEFWQGVHLGLLPANDDNALAHERHLCELLGFATVRNSADLWGFISEQLRVCPTAEIYAFWDAPQTPSAQARAGSRSHLDFQDRLQQFLSANFAQISLHNCSDLYFAQVLPLDAQRADAMRTASAKTAAAFAQVLAQWPQFKSENQLRGYLEYALLSASADGLAFATIVAGGSNAEVLHYQKSDDPLGACDLVLLDFGLRYGSVCTDISRTLPVNGRFDPLQKLLYQIVLDTQAFFEERVRPGVLLRDLNAQAWQYLESLLSERFFSRGGIAHRLYPLDPQAAVAPHGISHAIGLQVHEGDIYREYQNLPLVPGMLLSNEPGLYGRFSMEINGVNYHSHLGIRIEDDLLVTPTGCENMSAGIPKTIAQLEQILSRDN